MSNRLSNEPGHDLDGYDELSGSRILAERNVAGKVPLEVFWRIMDDMRVIGSGFDSWTCDHMRRYRLHKYCKTCPTELDVAS